VGPTINGGSVTALDIIIPTYGRPDRLAAVVSDAHAGARTGRVVTLVVEADDKPTVDAAAKWTHHIVPSRLLVNRRTASYAGAINTACLDTGADYVFFGADDLHFHPGWYEEAVAMMDGTTMVVGTNDLFNQRVLAGNGSTHHLVDMRYLREQGGTPDQGPGIALHEGYSHNYVDTEFIEVAKARGVFKPCLTSVVEHLHVQAGKAPMDATYAKGLDRDRYLADDRLFRSRVALWT
jgi:glycosyltransferase involved in cell wall biosynthesis